MRCGARSGFRRDNPPGFSNPNTVDKAILLKPQEGANGDLLGRIRGMTHHWLAGTAAFDVTPPLGIEMTGYANRPGPASDVHDPLWVRALALSDGVRRVALVSLDLLGLAADVV